MWKGHVLVYRPAATSWDNASSVRSKTRATAAESTAVAVRGGVPNADAHLNGLLWVRGGDPGAIPHFRRGRPP